MTNSGTGKTYAVAFAVRDCILNATKENGKIELEKVGIWRAHCYNKNMMKANDKNIITTKRSKLRLFCICTSVIFLLTITGCSTELKYESTEQRTKPVKSIYLKSGALLRGSVAIDVEENTKETTSPKTSPGGNGWRRTGTGSGSGTLKVPQENTSSVKKQDPKPAKKPKKPLDPYDDIDKSYRYGDAYDDAWDFAYDYWWQKVKGRGPACESWHSNRRAIEIYWGKISLA